MAIPVIIILLVVYFYVLVILLCYLEIGKEADSGDGAEGLSGRNISILVPFRNEQDHIGNLAGDFGEQSFPPGQWEVIFIDDHSTDDSARILAPLLAERANFHYHRLPPDISGKKGAISHGIQHAVHDRIIQVDADCRVPSGFISSHVSFLEESPSDLVAGLVTTGRVRGNFLETFERMDILALAGVGAGSFKLGRPLMCSGANLNYSRQLYLETRAFDPGSSVPSGDDMFLMIGARKLGKSLTFNLNPQSMVTSRSCKKLEGPDRPEDPLGRQVGPLQHAGHPDRGTLGVADQYCRITASLVALPLYRFVALAGRGLRRENPFRFHASPQDDRDYRITKGPEAVCTCDPSLLPVFFHHPCGCVPWKDSLEGLA